MNRESSIEKERFDDSRFTIHDLRTMYRKPRFLEVLHTIREEMSREADYDVDLFAEMVRSGARPAHGPERNLRGFKSRAPRESRPAAEKDLPQRGRKKRAAR